MTAVRLPTLAQVGGAFFRRDYHIATSYKLNFCFQLLAGFFTVALFYFVAKLVALGDSHAAIRELDTDYFSYVLVGIATTGLLHTGVALSERLRSTMSEGSLQMMLVTPVRPAWILVLPLLWDFFFDGLKAIAILLFGVYVFGAHLSPIRPACVIVVLATLVSFSVFGLFSVATILWVKRGDPVHWAFEHVAALVAGAYFPVDVLPGWLAQIAKFLPMTYAYEGVRKTLLAGASLAEVRQELALLIGFSVVFLPLAVLAANGSVRKAKRDGSVGFF